MTIFNWLRQQRRQGSNSAPSSDPAAAPSPCEKGQFVNLTVSGPFTSGNLSVFLLKGEDVSDMRNVMTLEEALANKKVVVKETGNVQQLTIRNESDVTVFVQSGDIVKGGRQDRTLQHDMILPAHSDFLPINSFCVEQGRWCQRGKEDSTHFGSSEHYLASKQLRMAIHSGIQYEVWNSVSELQHRGALNAGAPLPAVQGESASSLSLTMDTNVMREHTAQYVDDLNKIVEGQGDALGYAIAINGQINSIDVYASNLLFAKMWPKLLRAAATEAFCELKEGTPFTVPESSAVQQCMQDAEKSQAKELAISGSAKIVKQESNENVLFETRDLTNQGQWVHRNYATK